MTGRSDDGLFEESRQAEAAAVGVAGTDVAPVDASPSRNPSAFDGAGPLWKNGTAAQAYWLWRNHWKRVK